MQQLYRVIKDAIEEAKPKWLKIPQSRFIGHKSCPNCGAVNYADADECECCGCKFETRKGGK